MQEASLQFLDALTLAEIASFETVTGVALDKLDTGNPSAMLPGLAALAAQRLGIDATPTVLQALTLAELDELFTAASRATPTRPDDINKILEVVRGKSHAHSSKRSGQ